jgi:hypothetical protein
VEESGSKKESFLMLLNLPRFVFLSLTNVYLTTRIFSYIFAYFLKHFVFNFCLHHKINLNRNKISLGDYDEVACMIACRIVYNDSQTIRNNTVCINSIKENDFFPIST